MIRSSRGKCAGIPTFWRPSISRFWEASGAAAAAPSALGLGLSGAVISAPLSGSSDRLPVFAPTAAQAFFGGFGRIVYDPRNHAQNLMTAARTLEQINNQILSLQNEAQMLINQARDLTSLPHSSLAEIQQRASHLPGGHSATARSGYRQARR